MDVCCVKMASRCRPSRTYPKETPQLSTLNSYHDCGSLSRVVMVRKTDQRMINHKKPDSDPQFEFLTFETIQTFRGHKPDQTVVFKEKHEMLESEAQKSPCAQRFLRTATPSRELSRYPSSTNLKTPTKKENNTPNQTKKVQQEDKNAKDRLMIRRHSSPSSRNKITTFTEFEKDCLKAHNLYRSQHGVPPLKLNKKLCHFAEDWAKILSIRGTPAHRNNSPYGENIFSTWTSSHTSQTPLVLMGWEPVEHWYSEEPSHAYSKEPTSLRTGHFTQVVWRDSQELGVGQAKNRSGQIFVVANYDPPGNFIGSFVENVPPLLSASNTKSNEDNVDSSDTSNKNIVNMDLFVKAMLKYHNDYRRKHKVPELKLDVKLCNLAQDWAETLAVEDRIAHRPDVNYGENIYCLWSSEQNAKVNPREVCQSWYDEIKEYSFDSEPRGSPRAGHFTQMVWKATKYLGVGVAKTKKGKVLVVCNYNPRGNVIGEFGRNINRGR